MLIFTVDTSRAEEKLKGIPPVVQFELRRFIERLTEEAYMQIREDASLQDHSLDDLAALGHPYSRRFGSDTLHADYLLHQQSGTWLSMLTRAVQDLGNKIEGRVTAGAWYAFLLEYGTVFMRPRPIIAQNAEVVRQKVADALGGLRAAIVASVQRL